MLDQRKSEIWKALGIGPQWIERDELAKAAEEAVKAKAEAAAAKSLQAACILFSGKATRPAV